MIVKVICILLKWRHPVMRHLPQSCREIYKQKPGRIPGQLGIFSYSSSKVVSIILYKTSVSC